jgi:hypothetical protein
MVAVWDLNPKTQSGLLISKEEQQHRVGHIVLGSLQISMFGQGRPRVQSVDSLSACYDL